MEDTQEQTAEQARKKAAVAVFIASLATGAKTGGLYKAGHGTILQIAERLIGLLKKTLGQETTLTLDIKAKTAVLDGSELEPSAEITAFCSALHTLGIGQLLLTDRLTSEGMVDFFKVLTAKPDEKTSLADLQKGAQALRIDGLQMIFILNFVVTGEEEVKEQKPGRLSEEQILSYLQAKTLPDFLSLLLHQNEDLLGKEAEAVTDLLEGVLYREIAGEDFETRFDWGAYDPRIKARWTSFRRPAERRDRGSLVTWASVHDKEELAQLHSHPSLERAEAVGTSLEHVLLIMSRPGEDRQLKYALYAYVRLLTELGRDGRVERLLEEHERWERMAEDPKTAELFGALLKPLQEGIPTPAFAQRFADAFAKLAADAERVEKCVRFISFFGSAVVPLLLEELRAMQDKDQRALFSRFLASVGKSVGRDPFIGALRDDDWLLVVAVVWILAEMGAQENNRYFIPLLKHGHRRVREAAMKALVRSATPAAIAALAGYVATREDAEEASKAVIALSLMSASGVDVQLIGAFPKARLYHTQVGIATALGRFPGPEAERFLKATAKRSLIELITGRNKDLRLAARHSLERLKPEGKG